ncbi:MAG TPA: ribonuclease III domain-containing protein [Desulfobacteria bacterium]|nr:ribonuclease III domain-containing protein [Desulfobacteria bacterium]
MEDIIKGNPAAMPALVLAYLGDAVYELHVRRYLISCGITKVNSLHKRAVKFVNASTQARVLHTISETLSETEMSVVKRGRNAKSGSVPKNTSISEYRHGTAFECLIGYLSLSGREDRIAEIFKIALEIVMLTEEGDTNEGKTY